MNTTCSRCGWSNARISAPASILDWVLKPLFIVPVRCRSCRARFYRFSTESIQRHPMSESQRAAFVAAPTLPELKLEAPVQARPVAPQSPGIKQAIKRMELQSSYRSMYIAANRREMAAAVKTSSVWMQNSVPYASQSAPSHADVSRSIINAHKRPTVWTRTCPEKV